MTTVTINNRIYKVVSESKTAENSALRVKFNLDAMLMLSYGKSETVYMANRLTDGTVTGLSKH